MILRNSGSYFLGFKFHNIFYFLSLFLFFVMNLESIAQGMNSKSEMYAFRLQPGEDLKVEIDKLVLKNGWKAVSIVTCVGSLNTANIRFANQKDATTIAGKLEIVSLSGLASHAGSHLHIAVSDSTGKTTGGHLMKGCQVYTTAEIVLAILTDVVFEREPDKTYGYKELVIKPLK